MASGTTPTNIGGSCTCQTFTAWPGVGHLPGCPYWVPIVYERTTTAPPPNANPHRCPVCEGRGAVHAAFYSTTGEMQSSSTNDQRCRTCGGTGVLWR